MVLAPEAGLAVSVGVGVLRLTALSDGWPTTKKAISTATMPRKTVTTKVTAPHSRRRKDPFKSG